MPALPTSISSSNPGAEAALTATTLLSSNPLLLLLTIFSILYFLGPSIFSWRFPCQTIDDLDVVIANLVDLINSSYCLKRDLIGWDDAQAFKSSLHQYVIQSFSTKYSKDERYFGHRLSTEAYKIKLLPEPPRTNPFVWLMFRWKVLRDIDACYVLLKVLEWEVKAKIHA
ncbi:hypothetical protein MPER_11474 [Moniliophthora perniciosa FA553]|nr:hypothetical protein MPER_11474 [Moniliophthora perniciosa FA553]